VSLRWRRIRAVTLKELREFRRNRPVLVAIAIFPLIFLIQPLAAVFLAPGAAASSFADRHLLLYMLGIPILTPATLAAYSIVGERQQETLEPVLTTPITREELLIGKAIASFAPAVVIAYAVYVVFLVLVAVFAQPAVASALVRGPDLIAQIVFTPVLAAVAVWVGIAISTRTNDVRVAQQLSLLGILPLLVGTSLIAFGAVHPTSGQMAAIGALLVASGAGGWRLVGPMLDRERLITNSR
jgi:ABC-type transport system involved in multi-copper enzyme maturation permease subunit